MSPRKRIVAQKSVSGTMKLATAASEVATASQVTAAAAAPVSPRPRASAQARRMPATAETGASQAHGIASRQPITGS